MSTSGVKLSQYEPRCKKKKKNNNNKMLNEFNEKRALAKSVQILAVPRDPESPQLPIRNNYDWSKSTLCAHVFSSGLS